MTRWAAPGGWEIDAIRLNRRDYYRVLHHGYLINYCYSWDALLLTLDLNGVPLDDLVESAVPHR